MSNKNILLPLLLAITVLASFKGISQNIHSVSGKIRDKENPVEFATITIFNKIDSVKSASSTLSDSAGNFSFNKLPSGEYLLKVQMIGYKPVEKPFFLNQQQIEYDAGFIVLDSSNQQLEGVFITAQKKSIQRTTQGFVINVSSNLTQTGGTATDILRNTPTVVVDAEGSITIRGKAPLILVNGRNSGLSGTDQIPASTVESIEIINNPSAQYDAEAEGGIINIKLKKYNQRGTNGALAIGGGFGAKGRFNSSAFINHKSGQWNYSLAYDNRFAGRTRNVNGDRINYSSEENRFLVQRRHDDRVERLQNLRLNIDFSPDKKNSFSFEATGNLNGEDNDESLINTFYTASNSFESRYYRQSIEIRKAKLGELALNYARKYSNPRKSLSAGINTAFNSEQENTDITTQSLTENNDFIDNPFLQRTTNDQNTNVSNLKLDFVQPLSQKSSLETGYKTTLRFLNADFQSLDQINGDYIINPYASSIISFDEQIHAAYLLYSSSIGETEKQNWKYDAGLRAELVSNDGIVKNTQEEFSNDYFKLFPSMNIAYYMQPKAFWKFSYSRRINRPGLGQLNPFTDITDSLNQRSGNPYLKPELVHSTDFGYNRDWSKVSLYSVAFYRIASDVIRPFTELRTDGVAYTKPVNFGYARTYGIENILSAKPFSHYEFNLSVSFFEQYLEGTGLYEGISNRAFSWYGKLINNFVLWTGSKLQVTGSYNAPTATPQGERIEIYYVDLGFQQKFGKGKGRLGVVITDIFNTQKNGFLTNGDNFTFLRTTKVDSRALLVTFAYTFGTSFKEKLMENQFTND